MVHTSFYWCVSDQVIVLFTFMFSARTHVEDMAERIPGSKLT